MSNWKPIDLETKNDIRVLPSILRHTRMRLGQPGVAAAGPSGYVGSILLSHLLPVLVKSWASAGWCQISVEWKESSLVECYTDYSLLTCFVTAAFAFVGIIVEIYSRIALKLNIKRQDIVLRPGAIMILNSIMDYSLFAASSSYKKYYT